MSAMKAPRIAASLLLLRPRPPQQFRAAKHGEEDYEVLMMERSDKRGAFRGAVVFPGGVSEDADKSLEWSDLLKPSQACERRHLKLTAVRELFEETGILLSSPLVKLPRETMSMYRARVHENAGEFVKACKELDVKPDLDSLKLIQNWVTPIHLPVRFDTFFFLAVTSLTCGAEADGLESVQVAWLPPSRWLELYEEQKVSLLPPQYYQLAILAGSPKLEHVVKLWNSLDESIVEPWLPVPLSQNEGPGLCYPGDASHPKTSSTNLHARHRLYTNPVSKKADGVAGKGMVSAVGGIVAYELERNVLVPFGQDSWGAKWRKTRVNE